MATQYIDKATQGKSGPIQASFPEVHGPLGKAWPETFENLGFGVTGDPLSGQSLRGYSYLSSVTAKTRERSYAGSAYYSPVSNRPNLHLLTSCMVEKVLFARSKQDDLTAVSVQFTHNGSVEVRNAKKDIILCAGVFGSPQLLELSGIGQSELLKSNGIESLVESHGVGENLQDHPMTGLSLEVVDGLPTGDMGRDPQVAKLAMDAYQNARQGPLSSSVHSVTCMPVVDFHSD